MLAHPQLAACYQIVGKIGQGGMGALFAAKDRELDREVALKLMLATSGEDLARFEREGRALAQLTHPNVLKVYAVEVCDGVPVLVLELLLGTTLGSIVRLMGPYPPKKAGDVVAQVLDGLAAAHDAGIVYRDLKPGNILMLRAGGPRAERGPRPAAGHAVRAGAGVRAGRARGKARRDARGGARGTP